MQAHPIGERPPTHRVYWGKGTVHIGFRRIFVSFIFASITPILLVAQENSSTVTPDATLPDAPQAATAPQLSGSSEAGAAAVSGTVLDRNGNPLQDAQITLAGPGSTLRTLQSGNNGQFSFTGLPPDTYKLTVSALGMSTYTLATLALHAGDFRLLPPIAMSVADVATTVTVTDDKAAKAEEQLHIAEQQRIGGVIPNFYSSYDWNAPPMQAKQKFQLGIRSVIDPISLLSVAGLAGAEQYQNVFPGFGGGIEGYGKRYGAALANHAAGTLLGRAVYPSIFHQDPRYFYKGKGSIGSRALYAIAAAVIARGDDGRWKPNYSRVLGNLSAAGLSNLYYPSSNRGASLIVLNGLGGIGTDAVANLIREFVLKGVTSHVPRGANGQP